MTTTTIHAPGTFCWPELATSDYAGAKRFYSGLFGWGVQDNDMGGGEMYGMLKQNDLDTGAVYRMGQEEAGRPPHWNAYVAVASADEAAARAKQLGGTVLKEPFDVFDIGRMAVIQDPTGAVFCAWQAKKQSGVGVLDEPGSLCWTELLTRDAGKAAAFYTGLLPWGTEVMQMGPTAYTVFKRGDASAGGMMEITPEMGPVPSYWMPYFAVTDCDASFAKAGELGGTTVVGPTNIPNVGRFAILHDPQGALFGILGPERK